MFSELERLQQLELCFLFLRADGPLTPEKEARLGEILEGENLSPQARMDFDGFRREVSARLSAGFFGGVPAEVDRLMRAWGQAVDLQWPGGSRSVILRSRSEGINGSAAMQAHTLWTMIRLSCAEGAPSPAEDQVIRRLAGWWETDPALLAELRDIAGTWMVLLARRARLQAASQPPGELRAVTAELDRSIACMRDSVWAAILEADVK